MNLLIQSSQWLTRVCKPWPSLHGHVWHATGLQLIIRKPSKHCKARCCWQWNRFHLADACPTSNNSLDHILSGSYSILQKVQNHMGCNNHDVLRFAGAAGRLASSHLCENIPVRENRIHWCKGSFVEPSKHSKDQHWMYSMLTCFKGLQSTYRNLTVSCEFSLRTSSIKSLYLLISERN